MHNKLIKKVTERWSFVTNFLTKVAFYNAIKHIYTLYDIMSENHK